MARRPCTSIGYTLTAWNGNGAIYELFHGTVVSLARTRGAVRVDRQRAVGTTYGLRSPLAVKTLGAPERRSFQTGKTPSAVATSPL